MSDSLISIDGNLTTPAKAGLDLNSILGQNGVYAIVNTLGHKPLHTQLKLRYALDAFEALYGTRPNITAQMIAKEIYDLLHFGLYPEGGNTVTLWLLPTKEGGCRRYIVHKATTPYEGYGLLSIRPHATIANYEIPFERFQTSISLSAAQFATIYAERTTAGAIALRASCLDYLLSSEDSPLLVVKGFKLMTAPVADGGRNSAERELLLRLVEMAGLEVEEKAPTIEEIDSYDEIMVMTPVGIMSIYSVGQNSLANIYAHILSKHLSALTREGLAQ